MRRFILAAVSAFAVAGVAAAQQPPVAAPPAAAPAAPPAATTPPAAPAPGPTVIRGGGCSSCGTAAPVGSNIRGAFQSATGGNCLFGYGCQNGCGSLKSTLAFQFAPCKDFFAPNGPTCASLRGHCGYQEFAKPFGTGWNCPRQYDTYMNH